MNHRLTTEPTVKKLELVKEGSYENLLKLSIFMFISLIILLAVVTGSFQKADYWYHLRYVLRLYGGDTSPLPRLPLFPLPLLPHKGEKETSPSDGGNPCLQRRGDGGEIE